MNKKTLVIDALPLVIKEIESYVPGYEPNWNSVSDVKCQYGLDDDKEALAYCVATDIFNIQEDDYELHGLSDNITLSDWLNEWYRLASEVEFNH